MKGILKLLICFCAVYFTQSLDACTAFQLTSQDGAHVYCRSMEFGVDFKSNLLVVPREFDYKGTAPENKTGLQWKTKYGFVGMNQWISPTLVTDGMNEKGLVIGVLYLPGFTEYEKPDNARTNQTLGAWELASYLLGTCANLDDVKGALEKVLVAQQNVPEVNFSFPLHYYIADNQGKVIVVEYVKGKRVVYDNPVGVLTNSPSFDWHLINLSNFVNLSPINVAQLQSSDDKVKPIGQGSGLLGIPGDYTPPSRFIRAALFSQWATSPPTGEETARLGFHILNTFDIFFGIIREKATETHPTVSSELQGHIAKGPAKESKDSEYTQWVVVHDRNNLKTYFRTYNSLQIQMVDLKKIDFTQKTTREIKAQQNFVVQDVTNLQ